MNHHEILAAVNELKSIHQAIGAIGVRWRRCKPGTKRSAEYEKAHDALLAKSYTLSDSISAALMLGVQPPTI